MESFKAAVLALDVKDTGFVSGKDLIGLFPVQIPEDPPEVPEDYWNEHY